MVNHDTKLRTRVCVFWENATTKVADSLYCNQDFEEQMYKLHAYMIAIFEKSQSIVITSKICNKGQILEFSHLKATLAFNVHSLQ